MYQFITTAWNFNECSPPWIPIPEPLKIVPGSFSEIAQTLLWTASDLIRKKNLIRLNEIYDELRRCLGSIAKPLDGSSNATDQTFHIIRIDVHPKKTMEALTLALGASVASLCLVARPNERLALVIEHVAKLAELISDNDYSGSGDAPDGRKKDKHSRSECGKPHPLIWLGYRLIKRWVTIHQVFFAVMSAASLAMRIAHAALETGHNDRGIILTGLAEILILDGIELFKLTPTGLRYQFIIRPYMAAIAPGLSGGDGTEHKVFIQDYRRLVSFETDRPSVMASLGTLRGAYALAFDHHRNVCAHAVGKKNGSLKNPDHGAPEVLKKLKISRTSKCPIHKIVRILK